MLFDDRNKRKPNFNNEIKYRRSHDLSTNVCVTGAELRGCVGVGRPRWISTKSVLITVLYYFLKVKTPAGNRKDPNNIFIWLRPWCVIYRSC